MTIDPKPGLVIRYDFLWRSEHEAGREHGVKDRPCAIILVSMVRDDGSREVVLCPVTHSPPGGPEQGVEIPARVARHLGLDSDRSWVKTDQVNTVRWQPDRIPYGVVPARDGQWTFGLLPHDLGRKVFEQVRMHSRERALGNVRRDD